MMKPVNISKPFYPISPVALPQGKSIQQSKKPSTPFASYLTDSLSQQSLKFSKHALSRLEERGLSITEQHMSRLEEGLAKAKQKGAKESLMVLDEIAFVVSVKNSTVITAIDREDMTEQVITNIDSAVWL